MDSSLFNMKRNEKNVVKTWTFVTDKKLPSLLDNVCCFKKRSLIVIKPYI